MRNIFVFCFLLSAAACGKKTEPVPSVPLPVPSVPLPPQAAILLSPASNEVCVTGENVSPTHSSVAFSWQKSENTDSYEIRIKNLLSRDSIVASTTSTSISMNILKGTPYSWVIVSKSNRLPVTAKSLPSRFYNSGPGVTLTTPYPAEIIYPAWGEQVTTNFSQLTLMWKADPRVKNYDIYYGLSSSPTLLENSLSANQLKVTALTGKTYYWKVVARDQNGSTAESQIFNFYVR